MPPTPIAPSHPEHAGLYMAWLAHDARFDGRIFVGVTSTKIYCRPVCRVRAPLARNCRFFANSALAESEGFRPCLRCRPELAPGLSLVDSTSTLAAEAQKLIDQAVARAEPLSMPAVARKLGVTDRHLRRIFTQAHGVAPTAYVNTRRLLLAKQLLTDTDLTVTDVALSSGFGSIRRFNASFATAYRMSPSRLRQQSSDTPGAQARQGHLHLRLGYRPPYDVQGMLRFLQLRALPGVEQVDGPVWRRTVRMPHKGHTLEGWVQARFDEARSELEVDLAPVLAPVLPQLMALLRHVFDLDAQPQLIDAALARLPCTHVPGVRLPGSMDGFETTVRIILGQQITVAAARTLAHRVAMAFGNAIQTPHAGLNLMFPDAAMLARASAQELGELGIIRSRVASIQALAAAVAEGRLALHAHANLQATREALLQIKGIGEWTAQLVAMRVLAWPDAFAGTDLGLLNALQTRDQAKVREQASAWSPWRAYAVVRLWQTLEAAK